MIDATNSIKACAAYYGEYAGEMESYILRGEKKALELENRGPIKFDENGKLCPKIRKSYSDNGFYIFENVINPDELNDIKYMWDNKARSDLIDYNLEDLSI